MAQQPNPTTDRFSSVPGIVRYFIKPPATAFTMPCAFASRITSRRRPSDVYASQREHEVLAQKSEGCHQGCMSGLRVGIFGAGAIGGYLGIRLSAAGVPVTLVGRQSLHDAWPHLKAFDLQGNSFRPSKSLTVSTNPADLADCGVCLVTVKSGDTAEAAVAISPYLRSNVPVISLQNGLRNVAVLRSKLQQPVLPGMVTFNVLHERAEIFRKATSGPIYVGGGPTSLQPFLDLTAKTDEPITIHPQIEAIQAAKLLLNLNNGLCAITGLSIAETLAHRDLRRSFALCLNEGLEVMSRAGLTVGKIGPLSPGLVAKALTTPDWVFRKLAGSMMEIDPAARSSTLQDLDRGRKTEIDYLNGEIVRLATEVGMKAPANAFVVDTVHSLERAGRPLPFLRPEDVWSKLQQLAG
jgi:2-dehydropantoate 2-reductase